MNDISLAFVLLCHTVGDGQCYWDSCIIRLYFHLLLNNTLFSAGDPWNTLGLKGEWLRVLILCFVFEVVDSLFVSASKQFENICSISRNFVPCSAASSGASSLCKSNSLVLPSSVASPGWMDFFP